MLDLTPYEIGNTILRLSVVQKKMPHETAADILEATGRLTRLMNLVTVSEQRLPQIFEVASETGLTFYDASYLYSAHWLNLELVTDDVKLASLASKKVRVLNSHDLLHD